MFKKFFERRQTAGLKAGDAAYMNDLQQSLLTQASRGSKLMLYVIAAVLLSGVGWAYFARVEEITMGEAKIISKSREQVIQSLEGGIIEQMNVSEGDIVEKGQILLKIDPTRAESSYYEGLSKVIGLKARISRLRSEAYHLPLEFDDSVRTDEDVIQEERRAYDAHLKALNDSVSVLEQSYALSMGEINLSEPLAAKGLISEVEILRMRRQASELKSKIVERKNLYEAEASGELSRLSMDLSQAEANLVGREDIVGRTTLTAPVRGTVKNIRFNTQGGVIQPGEHILEIIPLEEQLLVEGKIRPSDVAFLRPGLPAVVKISAYDFSIYGGLKGVVQNISPDTIKDDQKAAAGRADDTYFRVLILTESSTLKAGNKFLPIIPGMVATVEIRTGEKTILDYLLKPVLKAREAFRER